MAGNRQWRFSFWPVLAFALLLPALLALGAWQLQRGFDKQASYEKFARESAAQAVDASGLSLGAFESLPAYRRVELRGRYLDARQFLLDNMPRQGRPGHHVLTPFAVEGRDYLVVVDRGWRPGLARDAAGGLDVGGELRVVSGLLAPLPRPALALDGATSGDGWPRVVQFPDADELAAMLDAPVARYRLLLGENAAEGFERDWQPPGIPPARHFAYAFQWFALAVALVVIFVVMARPRADANGD